MSRSVLQVGDAAVFEPEETAEIDRLLTDGHTVVGLDNFAIALAGVR